MWLAADSGAASMPPKGGSACCRATASSLVSTGMRFRSSVVAICSGRTFASSSRSRNAGELA